MSDIREPRWQTASQSLQPRPRVRTGTLATLSTVAAEPSKFKPKSSMTGVRARALRKYGDSRDVQRRNGTTSVHMSMEQALIEQNEGTPAYASLDRASLSRTSYTPIAPRPLKKPTNVYDAQHSPRVRNMGRRLSESDFAHYSDEHIVPPSLPPAGSQPPPPLVHWFTGEILPPLPSHPPEVFMPSGSDSSGSPFRKKPAASPYIGWTAGTTAYEGTVNKTDSAYGGQSPRLELAPRPSIGLVRGTSGNTEALSGFAIPARGRLKHDYTTFDSAHRPQQGQGTQPNVGPSPASYYMSPETQHALTPGSFIFEGTTKKGPAFRVPVLHDGDATPPSPRPKAIYHCNIPNCAQIFQRKDLYERHKDNHTTPGSQSPDSLEGSNSNRKQTTTSHTPSYTFQIDEIDECDDRSAKIASDIISSSAYRFPGEKPKYTISEDRTMDARKRHKACFLALKQPTRHTTKAKRHLGQGESNRYFEPWRYPSRSPASPTTTIAYSWAWNGMYSFDKGSSASDG